jgi:uncharacterized protein YbjT (DUF2867 family)
MDLVSGATGYIGGLLLRRLAEDGREARALVRNPARLDAPPGVEVVRADVLGRRGLEAALDGCETAYYLIHSMERGASGNGDFSGRDRVAARNFAAAAEAAGVERIVYLGGIVPALGRSSPHLRSRLEVERILLEAAPASTAFRASIVIGARSSSFRILVRLVERLRVLPFPAWRDHRTRPIDERDAIEYLVRAPTVAEAAGRSLDIAGPDVLSYREMIERIAEHIGVGRSALPLGVTQTPAVAAVVAAVAQQPLELVRPLMEGLQYDLLPRNDDARRIFGIRGRPFDRAVDHALAEWESAERLTAR